MDGLSLLEAARDPAHAARPALVHGGAVLRHADLAPAVAAACASLERAGAGPGARVAILAESPLGTFLALHALLALGAVAVPIHPRLTAAEGRALLDDARPRLVLRAPELASLERLVHDGAAPPAVEPGRRARSPDPAADLAIVYTSGTTGRPKGAVLSRRAFVAAAAASAANLGVRGDDRWLLCLPLCHVGGLSIVTRCLLSRSAVVLAPRFEPAAVLASIARDRATLLSVVPTMLLALLEADRDNVLASLRAVLVGGAAAPDRALDECARRGVLALTTYGLTEACSQVTSQRPRDPRSREPGSGLLLPGVEVRLAGVGADGAGRIQVRSPALARGTWRGPDLPPAPIADHAGWLETGDIGALDAGGRLHILARRTDLVVTGGENVYPAEIERALEACDGVASAVVFGVPDERWGQIVAAAIVPAGTPLAGPDPSPLPPRAAAALAAALASRLAPHKRPRRVCVVAELPVTSLGKLDRAAAAMRFTAALAPLTPCPASPPAAPRAPT